MTFLPPSSQAAPAHGTAFVPRKLVTIQVGCLSASMYPKVEPTMPIYELAHAYQVIKSALEALPIDMRLILEAIGMQLNCSAIVNGAMFDFRSLFGEAWYDFGNLIIQSFHDSAGKIIQKIRRLPAIQASSFLSSMAHCQLAASRTSTTCV
jgi:hypothetical protein